MSNEEIIHLPTGAKYIRPNGNKVEVKMYQSTFYYVFEQQVFTNLSVALLTADLNKNYLPI